jgi:hypothetical protein
MLQSESADDGNNFSVHLRVACYKKQGIKNLVAFTWESKFITAYYTLIRNLTVVAKLGMIVSTTVKTNQMNPVWKKET